MVNGLMGVKAEKKRRKLSRPLCFLYSSVPLLPDQHRILKPIDVIGLGIIDVIV